MGRRPRSTARLAAFRKEFAGCKTPLAAAIAAAEESTKGRAHAADVEFGRDQKLHLVVGLVVGDEDEEGEGEDEGEDDDD